MTDARLIAVTFSCIMIKYLLTDTLIASEAQSNTVVGFSKVSIYNITIKKKVYMKTNTIVDGISLSRWRSLLSGGVYSFSRTNLI